MMMTLKNGENNDDDDNKNHDEQAVLLLAMSLLAISSTTLCFWGAVLELRANQPGATLHETRYVCFSMCSIYIYMIIN